MNPRRPTPWLSAGLIVLAVVAAYVNSLHAPFIFDDMPAITDNASIRQLWPLGPVLSPPAEAGSAAGRPLVNLSFALNHAAGGLDPRGFHAGNLLLHALAALLLLGGLHRTLLQPALRDRFGASAGPLATVIALLWAVHPLQTEAVTCAVHRAEVMGGLFFLLTLYCAIRAMEDTASRRWMAGAIGACFAGVASKEIVATAPLVVLAYDVLFAAGSIREALRRRGGLYLALAGSWLLLLVLMGTSAHRGGTAGFGFGVSPGEYLLTQCFAVAHYLRLAFWPRPLVLDYGTNVVTAAREVLPQAALLLLLAGATGAALWRRRPAGFAGLWFFVILAPSSSFVPLVSQTMAEHRLYLPLAAVVALVVLALHRRLGRATLGLGAVLALACVVLTVRRNADYGSALEIWTDNVAKLPANPRAHAHLARALEHAGRPDEALTHYRAALRLAPDLADTHYNCGYLLLQLNRNDEAGAEFAEAVRLKPDDAKARSNFSVALLRLGRPAEAAAQLEEALRLDPNSAEAHYNLANLLARSGRLAAAIPHFEAAVRLDPARADVHFNLANALFESGRPAEAVPHYEAVLRLTPGDAEAARYLEMARREAGKQ